MPLVTEKEVARTLNLSKYGPVGINISRHVMGILKIKDVNDIYDRYSHLKGVAFIDAVLHDLDIRVDISDNDLKRIPKSGPFIMVANHPLGGIDGLIMLKLLLTYHPEAKIMANFLLTKIHPIQEFICPVNPFAAKKELFNSQTGVRSALAHLRLGSPLGLFPAGEVSVRKHGFTGAIDDKIWTSGIIKLIKRAGVPVVPVYFHARNSELFYLLSGINPNLRTASLPAEIFRSQHKKVQLRIGQTITLKMQEEYADISQYALVLRQKTYLLGRAFQRKKKFDLKKFLPHHKEAGLTPPVNLAEIKSEIASLCHTGSLLIDSGDYQVFFTTLSARPHLLMELGRLREQTFRAVGEGTNKLIDTDKYDLYYHHLILWDKREEAIAGAYRLGLGAEIYASKNLQGFYLSELFHMTGPMHNIFSKCIEMGRAFVCLPYQQKPMPLFLLWKGIAIVTKLYPTHTYLIGAVSISSSYCVYCQSIMVEFLRKYHFDEGLSIFVGPKHQFRSVLTQKDISLLDNLGDEPLREVDKMIEEIEPRGLKMPVLIKKYLSQNGKMLGFNVDYAFNNAIDCLMYIEISNIDMIKGT